MEHILKELEPLDPPSNKPRIETAFHELSFMKVVNSLDPPSNKPRIETNNLNILLEFESSFRPPIQQTKD